MRGVKVPEVAANQGVPRQQREACVYEIWSERATRTKVVFVVMRCVQA